MRGRIWLWTSLVGNALLALWLWRAHWVPPEPETTALPTPEIVRATNTVRTNVVVRRQHFAWNQIESADYATFIANLRSIGCPEATIRDIIVADVNQMFARRRSTEIVTPAQQWWRSEPDPEVIRSAAGATLALDRERRGLLTKLLGSGWESADYPYASALTDTALDGPALGSLAPGVKAAVHAAERQAADRLRAYLDDRSQAGLTPDPLDISRLRQDTRNDLARLLSPEQLEEYLLRYSGTSTSLRQQLRGFELDPDEFRALFRSIDSLDTELELAAADSSPQSRERREALERQRLAALRQTLGDERFESYQLSQDPLYRQAQSIVQQAGVSDDQLVPLAAIVRLTQQEEETIRNNLLLTDEERLEELQATREAQRASLRRLLGDEAYQRYLARQPLLRDTPQP